MTLWKAILLPNKANLFLWGNAVFMLFLLIARLADPLTIVFAYFLETIIIGFIHLLKLWLVSKYGKQSADTHSQWKGVIWMLFFTMHYGLFIAIQSVFAFALFQISIPEFKVGFDVLYNYGIILHYTGMPIILATVIVNNIKYFYTNFWQNRQFKDYTPQSIFVKPYLRIFIQQFVVIIAFFFYLLFASGIIAASLLIIFRLLVDLVLFSIKKDSRALELLTKKIAKGPEQYAEVSKQLQEFSE